MGFEKKLELKTMNQFLFLEINERVNKTFGSLNNLSKNQTKTLELDYATLISIKEQDKEYESSKYLIENLILKLKFLLDKNEN